MPIYDVVMTQKLYYRENIEAETPDDAEDEMLDRIADGEIESLDPNILAEHFRVTEVKEE